MPKDELKKLVRSYKIKAAMILLVCMLMCMGGNWYLIDSSIRLHYELGLPYASQDLGFIWGALIMGLFVVLYLCFYFFEQILLRVIRF